MGTDAPSDFLWWHRHKTVVHPFFGVAKLVNKSLLHKFSSFFFPYVPSWHLALVHIHRLLVSDTHVRAYVVVEFNHCSYLAYCFPVVPEHGLVVDPLVFDDAVHPLGHGIVRGVVALCHGNAYMVLRQPAHVQLAGILHAPVRVVDGAAEIAAPAIPMAMSRALAVFSASSDSDRHQPSTA